MLEIKSIADYLRTFGNELSERIVRMYPPLYQPGDPVSPRMRTLLRKPYPAQEVVAMSVVRRWQEARAAAVALHWKRRFWDCPSIYCTGIVEA